jgi:hypothetical protein
MPGGANVIAPAILSVTTTGVASAIIAAGGSGGTNGTQTVTGTTGTGTKFSESVTVAGGVITAVLSITNTGAYTINPTNLVAEPVTGGALTGAQLNIKMGVASLSVATPGSYGAQPTNPISPASTSGAGVGVAVNFSGFVPLVTPFVGQNAVRQYLAIRNESGSYNLGHSLGVAAFGATGTTTFGPNGDGFAWEGVRVPSNAMTVIGGAAFQQFTVWEG